MARKQFYRSTRDRKVAGVIGGISEFFGWPASNIRLAYVVLVCVLLILFKETEVLAFFLLLAYVGLWALLATDTTVWTNRVRRSRGTNRR